MEPEISLNEVIANHHFDDLNQDEPIQLENYYLRKLYESSNCARKKLSELEPQATNYKIVKYTLIH